MQSISSKKLCEILNYAKDIVETTVYDVALDSRNAKSGDLFVAIKGEKYDSHDFVKQAIENGCVLAIVERFVDDIPENQQIIVPNSLQAFGKIGEYNRSLYKGLVIGLTGSAGKTTTKEEIKFALNRYGKTYANSGNFNNAIGVPITLCNIDMRADYAIIEMGMSAKGEIEELVSYVKPDVAIITNVYPMHIEFFSSLEGIAEAKAEIFTFLKKDGLAIINEDTNFASLLEKRAIENGAKVIRYGKKNHPDVELNLIEDGEHNLYNAWCVLSLIKALELDIKQTAEDLKNFKALAGRGAKHQLKLAQGGEYTLIDDSYSGQPEAMKIAIESLDKMKTEGRKIVILGKMAELGDASQKEHIRIGKVVNDSSIDVVVGVCPEMKDMLAQLANSKKQYYFENKEGLDDFLLNNLLQNNDIVLIKGARYSSKLYQITDILLEKGK